MNAIHNWEHLPKGFPKDWAYRGSPIPETVRPYEGIDSSHSMIGLRSPVTFRDCQPPPNNQRPSRPTKRYSMAEALTHGLVYPTSAKKDFCGPSVDGVSYGPTEGRLGGSLDPQSEDSSGNLLRFADDNISCFSSVSDLGGVSATRRILPINLNGGSASSPTSTNVSPESSRASPLVKYEWQSRKPDAAAQLLPCPSNSGLFTDDGGGNLKQKSVTSLFKRPVRTQSLRLGLSLRHGISTRGNGQRRGDRMGYRSAAMQLSSFRPSFGLASYLPSILRNEERMRPTRDFGENVSDFAGTVKYQSCGDSAVCDDDMLTRDDTAELKTATWNVPTGISGNTPDCQSDCAAEQRAKKKRPDNSDSGCSVDTSSCTSEDQDNNKVTTSVQRDVNQDGSGIVTKSYHRISNTSAHINNRSRTPGLKNQLNLPTRLMKQRQSVSDELDDGDPLYSPISHRSRIRRCVSQPFHVNQAVTLSPPPESRHMVETPTFDPKHAGHNSSGSIAPDDGIFIDDEEAGKSDCENDDPDHMSSGCRAPQPSTPAVHDSRHSTCSTGSSITSQSSFCSETRTGREADPNPHPILAAAVWDNVSMQPEDLPFCQGDLIELIEWSPRSEMWYGCRDSKYGWFPSAYVKLLVSRDSSVPRRCSTLQGSAQGSCTASIYISDQSLPWNYSNNDGKWGEMRKNVIREILSTERDYVQLLQDLVEGFLHQARRRPDMFSTEQLYTMFANLEEIFSLHKILLSSLESSLSNSGGICESTQIGSSFLTNLESFSMYSKYCNNHPLSSNEISRLYQLPRYRHFFEACRLLRDMMELSLDGFLLSPVQRICKYPLQLAELIKWTPENHPDYQPLSAAIHSMKAVATGINDQKRRLDSLQKLLLWQRAVIHWRGPGILENSSCLINSGDVTVRFFHGSAGWIKDVYLCLFDHLLIFCKRDLLNKNQLVMKDRMCTDLTTLANIPDGKDAEFGVSVKHGFKVRVKSAADYCFLISCKTRKQKSQWLEAFRQERLIAERSVSSVPTEEEKRITYSLIKCQSRKPNTNSLSGKPDLLSVTGCHPSRTRHRPHSLARNRTWSIFSGVWRSKQ